MHYRPQKNLGQKWVRTGYFLGAILLHLILFLMLASYVIFKAPPPPPNDEFHAVAVKIAPPPPQPPSSGAEANNPQFEPQAVVVPVVTPPSMITTSSSSTFHLDAAKVLDQALSHLNDQAAQGTGLSNGGGGLGTGTGNAFGSSTGTGAQLSGYFYDLKQSKDRRPTGKPSELYRKFYETLTAYLNHGWDDSMLDQFFKSKAPLYTDSFAISVRPSADAPKAFNVEKEVTPSYWAIHYHGRVMAPESGDYQFLGFGDNILVVKIAGETVLDAGWSPLLPRDDLHKNLPFQWTDIYLKDTKYPASRGQLKMGTKFHMDVASPVDMDVLVGDDGGVCGFFLMIMKAGRTYETLPDGTPKAPFFQLNNNGPPSFSNEEVHPPYSTTPEPWQASPD